LSFGVESNDGSITLWFHCAHEGLKLDNINRDPRVGFEADCSHNLITGDKACSFTMEYESVVGCGNIRVLNDNDDKHRGLTSIMQHYAPGKEHTFTESEIAAVCVLRLDVTHISGKRLIK